MLHNYAKQITHWQPTSRYYSYSYFPGWVIYPRWEFLFGELGPELASDVINQTVFLVITAGLLWKTLDPKFRFYSEVSDGPGSSLKGGPWLYLGTNSLSHFSEARCMFRVTWQDGTGKLLGTLSQETVLYLLRNRDTKGISARKGCNWVSVY